MNEHECIALVRQAVEWQDAHLGAIRAGECPLCHGDGVEPGTASAYIPTGEPCRDCGGSGKARPPRLDDADWRSWYERARAALDAIE